MFLGHVILFEGLQVDPHKIKVIERWERPKTIYEGRSFLGFASYYTRSIEGFSELGLLLTKLTKKVVKLEY